MSNKSKTIGIFAPSAALKDGEKEFLDQGIKILEEHDFKVKLATNIYSKVELFSESEYFIAGDTQERLNAFHEIYQDPEVDLLLALRGGYGSVYLLPGLDYEMIATNPKPILGYSDLTALFMAIIKKTKMQCFHTPMLVELSRLNGASRDSFFNILSLAENFKIEKKNKKILGGNLTVLASLIGTDYLPDFKNAVLFLEDCNEEAYKIDRLINQLYLAGFFDNVDEIWLGKALGTKYNIQLLQKIADDKKISLKSNLDIGHAETKLGLVLG